jgi:tRNA A-37 threonylcarbamoyl transferase component Bud32
MVLFLSGTSYGILPHEQKLIDAAIKIRSSDKYLQKEYEKKIRWERVRHNAYYASQRQQHVIYLPVYVYYRSNYRY